ncbi:MAG TPA: hypothetical protein VF702_03925 [Allosphingosinicella sp.]
MLHLLREADASHMRSMEVDLTSEEQQAFLATPEDPIGVLLQTSKRVETKRLLLNHVMLALTADMLDFLYDGLIALSKRKYVVGFALLRKPLRETLFYLSLLLSDEEEFFRLFENGPAHGLRLREFRPDQRKSIFSGAINAMLIDDLFSATHLNDTVFDKSNPNGLAILFDQANHLVTSFNANLKTDSLNFNFVFKNPEDDDVFHTTYPQLAYALMYMFGIVTSLFSRTLPIDREYVGRLVLIMFAVYHSLFCRGSSGLLRQINLAFGELLKCSVCEMPFVIRKSNAPRFFVAERMVCKRCGSDTDFPILWLLGQAKLSFAKPADASPR